MIENLSPCEHRSRFVLIDLGTQWKAVEAYISGWSKASIVEWLALYGSVHRSEAFHFGDTVPQKSTFAPDEYYVFVPHIVSSKLYQWGFRFNEEGEFEVTALSMRQREFLR